jgi:hypothetical protein
LEFKREARYEAPCRSHLEQRWLKAPTAAGAQGKQQPQPNSNSQGGER